MKLEAETIEILKNFATINPSLLFKQGNELRTETLSGSLHARAFLTQSFERDFAIYDLSNFLSTLSLFEGPILTFKETHVVIRHDKNSAQIKYYYAEEAVVSKPKYKMEAIQTDILFALPHETLASVLKAKSVLGLPEIQLFANGSTLEIAAVDHKNKSSNMYTKDLGSSNHNFSIFFNDENLKFIPTDYNVVISKPKERGKVGFAYFRSPKVEYWVAAEMHSEYK